MNAAHFHLVINHFPVVLMIAATAIAIRSLIRKSTEARNIALTMAMVASAAGLATYFSGQPAADFLENAAIVNDMHIEEHEEAAEKAVIITAIAGLAAVATFLMFRRQSPHSDRAFIASTMLMLASTGALGWTGAKGGIIRHPEVNTRATAGSSTLQTHPRGEGDGGDMEESGDQNLDTEFEPSTDGTDSRQ